MRLDQVRHGDRVLAFYDKFGHPRFQPVIAFTGVFPNEIGASTHLSFDNGGDLILSPTHLVYAKLGGEEFADFHMAAKLSINSTVFFGVNPVRVISTTMGTHVGWYSPLTDEGTIVVNGVLVSCHTSGPHQFVRAIYSPLQLYLKLFPFQAGTSPDEQEQNVHWYSIGFRRASVTRFLESLVRPIFLSA